MLYDSKLIVEIMELPNTEQESDILKFYFDDLAEANDAKEQAIAEQKVLEDTEVPNIRYCAKQPRHQKVVWSGHSEHSAVCKEGRRKDKSDDFYVLA